MSVPKALQHPVLRRYRLRRWKLPVKGGRLSIVCPRTMEDLVATLDEDEFRRNERLPYWADVWASSVALARRLRRGPRLAGRRILDLGCGVGVAGAAAFSIGADVDFADCEPDALAFALFNAAQNRPVDLGPGRARALCFDWAQDTAPQQYDIVMCSDIVYEQRHHEPLLRVIGGLLEHGATALVADPWRAPSEPFFGRLAERFETELEEHDTWFPDRRVRVRIVTARRP